MARPAGSLNKDKPYREALRMELAEAGEDLKALRRIARAHIAAAETGDMAAIKELADRLDGKPAQESTNTNETIVRYVARLPDKASDSEQWQQQHAPAATTH